MNHELRIVELRAAIRRSDHEYYNLGQPTRTDAAYDDLRRELVQLEAAWPELVTSDSPTQRVGAPLPKGSTLATAAHVQPMGSIESLMAAEEVREFVARARRGLDVADDAALSWSCEPKLDGVSASLLYEDGRFVRGLSRGDGTEGEDISRNLRTIRNLPLQLLGDGPFPTRIEIRGEVILGKEDFERLRAGEETTGEGTFRNARNTVAGTLKLLDPRVVAGRPLDFLAFAIGQVDGMQFATHTELRACLQQWGFQLAMPFAVAADLDGVLAFHDDLERRRDALRYELDGIVAKVDRIDLQLRLGRTARAPRWALAYKFAPRLAVTRVLAIGAQVGRTGAVTPVAQLEPVELAGVTVRNASLHNWALLQERDVRQGDTIEVQRAGDVIPEIVRVFADQRPADSQPTQPPVHCPACATPLQTEGKFLYCPGLACPDQLRGRIVHMASRRAFDIDGLGPKQVDQLAAAGIVAGIEDVFTLAQHRDRVLALDRWGEKSLDNLVAAAQRSRQPALARFLNGLGIRHVGEQTAKDLAAHFGSLDRLRTAGQEQLLEVDGVGDEVAAAILQFFAAEPNQRCLQRLAAAGVQPREQAARQPGRLSGRVFVFTGSLTSMTRDAAKDLVEQLGATTAGSIGKKVTDVVAGADAGSKLDKARSLGLRILDEDAFRALVAAP